MDLFGKKEVVMALVTMKEMLINARRDGYAVGAFEFWSYDSAKAVVSTAEKMKMPVILQVGHFERDYMDGYLNAYRIAQMAAEQVSVPVALHLDHAEEYSEVLSALRGGFTSVMIDASAKSFEENVFLTREVVALAGKFKASVEAELGQLSGSEGKISSETDLLTDPECAQEFAEKTGIDALAVAIGTAHGFYKRTPHIDISRLKEIAGRVSIPLVLHGGSGTPQDKVAEAVNYGIAKVNICTEFIEAFALGIEEGREKPDFSYNVENLFVSGRRKAEQLVESKIKLFSNGKNSGLV